MVLVVWEIDFWCNKHLLANKMMPIFLNPICGTNYYCVLR